MTFNPVWNEIQALAQSLQFQYVGAMRMSWEGALTIARRVVELAQPLEQVKLAVCTRGLLDYVLFKLPLDLTAWSDDELSAARSAALPEGAEMHLHRDAAMICVRCSVVTATCSICEQPAIVYTGGMPLRNRFVKRIPATPEE